ARSATAQVSAPKQEVAWENVRNWVVKIREGRFFFGAEVTAFLEHVELMWHNLDGKIEWEREHANNPADIGDKIHQLRIIISRELLRLPEVFADELKFRKF